MPKPKKSKTKARRKPKRSRPSQNATPQGSKNDRARRVPLGMPQPAPAVNAPSAAATNAVPGVTGLVPTPDAAGPAAPKVKSRFRLHFSSGAPLEVDAFDVLDACEQGRTIGGAFAFAEPVP